MKRCLSYLLVVFVVVLWIAPASGQEVLAGLDFLETDASQSLYDATDLSTLCPNCFIVGDPLIQLQGVPLQMSPACPGQDLGSCDTIVRRLQDTSGLDVAPAAVQIEIVELHLQSIQPFQVNCEGADQMWMLDVQLDNAVQPIGQMTITKTHPDGGTFDSTLPVKPLFTFVRVDVLPTPQCFDNNPLNLLGGPGDWTYDPALNELTLPGCTTNFFLGIGRGSGSPASGHLPESPAIARTVIMSGGNLTVVWNGAQGGPVPTEQSTWGGVKVIYQDE